MAREERGGKEGREGKQAETTAGRGALGSRRWLAEMAIETSELSGLCGEGSTSALRGRALALKSLI